MSSGACAPACTSTHRGSGPSDKARPRAFGEQPGRERDASGAQAPARGQAGGHQGGGHQPHDRDEGLEEVQGARHGRCNGGLRHLRGRTAAAAAWPGTN